MDRNVPGENLVNSICVALRKESVDRNCEGGVFFAKNYNVALRKESVDRNCEGGVFFAKNYNVALRKESVDRNLAWHCMSEDVS